MDEQFFFDTTEIFRDLNPQQVEAVNCLEGPLLVMAGAGSGKTRVLTCRIANLIAHGISPENILAITFTNKAANEMKSRAMKLIGRPAFRVWLSTFHSFCARLLRKEIEVTGKFSRNFAIFDAADSRALVKQCVAELNLDEKIFGSVHLKISDLKNELIDVDEFKEHAQKSNVRTKNVAMIYELYQKKLQENNALDFDDLIFATVKIFMRHPEILDRYQDRYQYISIDEYQDTNAAQYMLTRLLASKYQNICVVGDADQSIYGWRGADMRNILNFNRDYPQARVILLEQNYRSTQTILHAANAVIENNVERVPKELWTTNERGEKIKLVVCPSDAYEAAVVAGEIRRLVDDENFQYKDIALLYRTNAQSRPFEERFLQAGIPYLIVGGLKFYDRREIKDIVAYLHVISNPRDNLHLQRIINMPKRELGTTQVTRLLTFADSVGLSVFEVVTDRHLLGQVGLTPRFRSAVKDFVAMMMSLMESAKNLSLDELIDTVLEDSGYYMMLELDAAMGKTDAVSRKENLGAFINSAKDFAELNPEGTLDDFLNHVALITDIDEDDESESRVKLMTVHAAKGLEFPAVFVVGMEDGLFPHANSFGDDKALEEERRACYVALTRAEKKLYITAAEERMFFGKIYVQTTSRFIDEIPYECLNPRGYVRQAPQKKSATKKSATKTTATTFKTATANRAAPKKKSAAKVSASDELKVGDRVNHKKWGLGTIMAIDKRIITISFANPEVGIKKLFAAAAPIKKF